MMSTATGNIAPFRERRSFRLDRYVQAGYSDPIHLTVRQEACCRRTVGISRFVYNLYSATHWFCRVNRLPWPYWQDL